MYENQINRSRKASAGPHGLRTALLGIVSTAAIGCAVVPAAAATAPHAPAHSVSQQIPGPGGYGDSGDGDDGYGDDGYGGSGHEDTGYGDTGHGMPEAPATSPAPSTTSTMAPPVYQTPPTTPPAAPSTTSPATPSTTPPASPSESTPASTPPPSSSSTSPAATTPPATPPSSQQPGTPRPRTESPAPDQLAKTGPKDGTYVLAAIAAALVASGGLCLVLAKRRRA